VSNKYRQYSSAEICRIATVCRFVLLVVSGFMLVFNAVRRAS
jgi:hypothetical protein